MTEGEALLADICAHPADDAPRMVYADWLEDHLPPDPPWTEDERESERNHARRDRLIAANAERAEFIRVQCELAAMDERGEGCVDPVEGHTCYQYPCPVCTLVEKYEALRRRERELHGNQHLWLPCLGFFNDDGQWLWEWRRGFVSRITLPCAAWLVHGAVLVRAAPLERVELNNKEPAQTESPDESRYTWFEGNALASSSRHHLPTALFRLLPVRYFTTAQRACDALSDACLALARAAAAEKPTKKTGVRKTT